MSLSSRVQFPQFVIWGIYVIVFFFSSPFFSSRFFLRCVLRLTITLSLLFSEFSSVLATFYLPNFLDTYNLLMSSVGCMTLCIDTNFFDHGCIYLRSSLVYFNTGPKFLIMGNIPEVYSFNERSATEYGFKRFLANLRYFFSTFFYLISV